MVILWREWRLKFICTTAQEIKEKYEKNGHVTGLFKMSDSDYHSLKFISSSVIKDVFFHSPLKAWSYFNSEHTEKPLLNRSGSLTPLGFGSAFHALILEPKQFHANFAMTPKHITGKAKLKFLEENNGKVILSSRDSFLLTIMEKNLIMMNSNWNHLTSEGFAELACFWKCPASGLQCKAKFDWYNPNFGIVDLKTTSAIANREGMYNAIKDFGYDFQALHYLQGLRSTLPNSLTGFAFCFVEKLEPWDSNTCLYTRDNEKWLMESYIELMQRLSWCLKNNRFLGHNNHSIEFGLPFRNIEAWAQHQDFKER